MIGDLQQVFSSKKENRNTTSLLPLESGNPTETQIVYVVCSTRVGDHPTGTDYHDSAEAILLLERWTSTASVKG